MQVLSTILYIILFLFLLSTLIAIHELGHLTAAKIFKVYCLEYSIGFGPRLIHVKRKTGETYFSLRIIPFGGFVSMYGEGVELPDGTQIDESRSLEGIKKWKKAIILVAGVTMNALLALTVFFVSELLPQQILYLRNVEVASGSVAELAGITQKTYLHYYDARKIYYSNDQNWENVYLTIYDNNKTPIGEKQTLLPLENNIYEIFLSDFASANKDDPIPTYFTLDNGLGEKSDYQDINKKENKKNYFVGGYTYDSSFSLIATQTNEYVSLDNPLLIISKNGLVTYKDETTKQVAVVFETEGLSFSKRDYDDLITYYGMDDDLTINQDKYLNPENNNIVKISFPIYGLDENGRSIISTHNIELKHENGKFTSLGLKTYLYKYQNNFGQALKDTFIDFGSASTAIVRGIASLFYDANSWKQMGGIVAIGYVSNSVLQNYGIVQFLQLWGIISVNLAIINLLPFPGLDGWQLTVVIFEAITRRKMPQKAKGIASFIGLALLFSLMIVVLVFDILRFVFHVI